MVLTLPLPRPVTDCGEKKWSPGSMPAGALRRRRRRRHLARQKRSAQLAAQLLQYALQARPAPPPHRRRRAAAQWARALQPPARRSPEFLKSGHGGGPATSTPSPDDGAPRPESRAREHGYGLPALPGRQAPAACGRLPRSPFSARTSSHACQECRHCVVDQQRLASSGGISASFSSTG